MQVSSARYFLLPLFLLCLFQVAEAQNLSRLRVKVFAVNDTIQLDSLNISPESVVVFSTNGLKRLSPDSYQVKGLSGELTWLEKPEMDSVEIVYRTFPFNFTNARFNKDPSYIEAYKDSNIILNPFEYDVRETAGGVIDFGTLDYNGSFARGVSFGNNQDVVLNSSFNLQLSGNITDDIEVVAALTDNNIPVQPDGNTQQIQEFDQVYIQLRMKNHQLTVGDYEIRNLNKHYFMRFYKRLQGGSYQGTFDFGDKGKLRSGTSLAIAKGKFTRNMLVAQEGNQGPYKLLGPNGETFIIVLAGTERVYINGELQKRGANFDYVIDYNLGEITFTPNTIITRDLRIAVEFEYSERNYFRTLIYLDNEYELNQRLNLRFNFFSEQDNKNQPSQIDLSAEQQAVLESVGDNLDEAFFPGAELVEYDADRILYKLVDTVINGVQDSFFVFSTNPDSAAYALSFSFVGQGAGDYVPAQTVANGRVFTWVEPVNGVSRGSYEPIIVLITPKREQLMTLGMDWRPSLADKVSMEVALSNDDQNTFSEQGDQDNAGMAGHLNYTKRYNINSTEENTTYMTSELDYEYTNRNFNALERYRPVEFTRDWNLTNFSGDNDQHLASAGLNFISTDVGNASYRFSTFQVGDEYSGYLHTLASNVNKKGYRLKVLVRYLTSEATNQHSQFLRPTVELSKSFSRLKGWTIGSRYEQEINKIRDDSTDVLLNSSFVFNDWRVYTKTADTAKVQAKIEYIRRLEFFTEQNDMELTNLSNTYKFNGAWETNRINQLRWQFTYRQFQNKDSVQVSGDKFQQFYLGRVEYGLNLFKGGITSNILYELGSGTEQRRSFTYLQVADGQGIYIWTDRNDNGIKELNEFDIAPANFEDQANYIRVSNPTNEFDPVNTTTYNQVISLNPRAVWYRKEGVKGFVARFSTITSLQLNRKVFRGADLSAFNPFIFTSNDDALLALNTLVRNSIFFNRSSSKYSLEYTLQDNENKVNLVSGFEVRSLLQHTMRVRWNMIKQLNLDVKYNRGERANNAEFFEDRVYSIDFNEVNPKLTFLPSTKFRLSGEYEFARRVNTVGENGETAISHEIRGEARYSVVSKSTLNFEFTFTNIDYNGSTNSSLEFAMLQGLQNGNNYTWRASYDRTLAKNVQLNLVYEGRKTGDADMVHIGRAQVRAIF